MDSVFNLFVVCLGVKFCCVFVIILYLIINLCIFVECRSGGKKCVCSVYLGCVLLLNGVLCYFIEYGKDVLNKLLYFVVILLMILVRDSDWEFESMCIDCMLNFGNSSVLKG